MLTIARVVTPPAGATVQEPHLEVVEHVMEAGAAGVKHIWMQPGAESETAVTRANELGMSVIAGGACFLVIAGYREDG